MHLSGGLPSGGLVDVPEMPIRVLDGDGSRIDPQTFGLPAADDPTQKATRKPDAPEDERLPSNEQVENIGPAIQILEQTDTGTVSESQVDRSGGGTAQPGGSPTEGKIQGDTLGVGSFAAAMQQAARNLASGNVAGAATVLRGSLRQNPLPWLAFGVLVALGVKFALEEL